MLHSIKVAAKVAVCRKKLGQIKINLSTSPIWPRFLVFSKSVCPSAFGSRRPLFLPRVLSSAAPCVMHGSDLQLNIRFRSSARRSIGMTPAITKTTASETVRYEI